MSFQALLTAPVGPGDRRPEFGVGESFSGCLSPKCYQGELKGHIPEHMDVLCTMVLGFFFEVVLFGAKKLGF